MIENVLYVVGDKIHLNKAKFNTFEVKGKYTLFSK